MTINTHALTSVQGVWIPLITPFLDDRLDERSLRQLIAHYCKTKIAGFVLAGTTGESMSLNESETRHLIDVAQEANICRLPMILGHTGANTRKLAADIARSNSWPVDGYLIASPCFTRPSQEGLFQHFRHAAEATERPIILYNIPYRTGVNIENDTIFRLAEHRNIVGIKDCCAKAQQTTDLIQRRPTDFSVLVGDDANFFRSVSQGADGGILASAHLEPDRFADVLRLLRRGRTSAAKEIWDGFAEIIPLLFAEPNPAPLKFCLHQQGLLASPEVRLPMTPISSDLQERLTARLVPA